MYQNPDDTPAGRRRRVVFRLTAAFLVVGASAAWFHADALRGAYRRWRQERSLAQAHAFAAQKDTPNTLLALKAALQSDSANPEAWRIAADFFEQSGDRQAIKLRQQVLLLEPSSAANRIALVNTALRFQDPVTAQQILEDTPPAARASADYQKAAAALAYSQGRPADAESLLNTVLQARPEDRRIRLDRAVLRLRYAPPETAAGARIELDAFAEAPDTRAIALRELAIAALRDGQKANALAAASRLAALPEASFNDLLLHAATQLAAGAALEEVLRPIQARVLRNPPDAIPLSTWLLATGRSRAVRNWIESLPESTRSLPPIRVAHVDCLNALGDWRQAAALVAEGAWGPIPPEAIQLAITARTLRDRGRPTLEENSWAEAVRLASGNLASLRVLHRLALGWGWEDESRAVLLAVARTRPDQTWAHRALVAHAYQIGDTDTLRTVYRLWRDAEPNNTLVEGNWAMLTLLAEPGARPSLAKTTAARLYASDPGNPFHATAHAFALWQLGRPADALKVMDTLSPEERGAPARAFYYALFLAYAGRSSEALRYLGMSSRKNLLPEERRLFIAAYEKTRTPTVPVNAPAPVHPSS